MLRDHLNGFADRHNLSAPQRIELLSLLPDQEAPWSRLRLRPTEDTFDWGPTARSASPPTAERRSRWSRTGCATRTWVCWVAGAWARSAGCGT